MIPKVIYICDKNLQDINLNLSSWQKLNPEYTVKIFDDEMCRSFISKEYSRFYLQIYDFLKDGPIKADFWRVCVLTKNGGIYVDSDIEPLVALKDFVEKDDAFITCINANSEEGTTNFFLNPHFIACRAGDVLVQHCLERYVEKYLHKHAYNYWDWSIMKIFQLPEPIEKKSQICYINNNKCKFLLEKFIKDENGFFRAASQYNDKNVFYGKNLKYKSQGK